MKKYFIREKSIYSWLRLRSNYETIEEAKAYIDNHNKPNKYGVVPKFRICRIEWIDCNTVKEIVEFES